MAVFLPRLRQGVAIGRTAKGEPVYPSSEFILFWQQFCQILEGVPAIANAAQEAQDAADAANAAAAAAQSAADTAQGAADAANAAADAATSESSIVASFPTNYTPPLIEAASTGDVTIANHDRQYGNTTLNPTVSVTGDTITTGGGTGDVIRVYYDDPTRAGGAVTYQFTVDPADPPVQGGDTHVVGAVTIPGVGSQAGNGVRPPGYVSP